MSVIDKNNGDENDFWHTIVRPMVDEADGVLEKLRPNNLMHLCFDPRNDDDCHKDIGIWLEDNIYIAFCVDFTNKGQQLKTVSIELDIRDSNKIITKTFKIIGFKIVGEINNQLIIEPIGDQQKIVKIDWKTNDTNDKEGPLFKKEKTEYPLQNIKKEKKYLLSLKEDDLLKSSDLIKEFNEHIKKHNDKKNNTADLSIIDPIINEQKIVMNNNCSLENNESKKNSLPSENNALEQRLMIENGSRVHKSLLGLGCIEGDEKSCCGCCYW